MIVLPEEVYRNLQGGVFADPIDTRLTQLSAELAQILSDAHGNDPVGADGAYLAFDQKLKELRRFMSQRADAGTPALGDTLAQLVQQLKKPDARRRRDDDEDNGGGGQPPPPPPAVVQHPSPPALLQRPPPSAHVQQPPPPPHVQHPPPPGGRAAVRVAASMRSEGSEAAALQGATRPKLDPTTVRDAIRQATPARQATRGVKRERLNERAEDVKEAKLSRVAVKPEPAVGADVDMKVLAAKRELDASNTRFESEQQPSTSGVSVTEPEWFTRHQELYRMIMLNPERYGVTRKGQILNPRPSGAATADRPRPFYRSTVEDALQFLLTPDVGGTARPPGTEVLYANLLQNADAAALLGRARTAQPTTRERILRQRAATAPAPQSDAPAGHGTAPFKTPRFRPALWQPRQQLTRRPDTPSDLSEPDLVGDLGPTTSDRIAAARAHKRQERKSDLRLSAKQHTIPKNYRREERSQDD
ncbi:hypothetical protein AAVH_31296 [Aphelenchoides avenae]|nr:hypothetical protein AAVH_31296 [Aphelenchus avenae]